MRTDSALAPGRSGTGREAPPRRVDRTVGLAAAMVLAVSATLFGTGAWWIRQRPSLPRTTVTVAFGPATLDLPAAWLNLAARRTEQPVERLDLRMSLKDLEGEHGAGTSKDATPVFVALLPQDGAIPPADRPTLLYARFLSADATAGAGGLIHRQFRAGTPYEGEELVLAPPDGRAFAARCAPPVPASETGGTCLAELRFARMDAQVRFAPGLLPDWERLVGALKRRFDRASP